MLIVKPEYEEMAKNIFAGSGVKITTGGERHMGAVIGSADFKEKYVKEKISNWIQDIDQLSEIVKRRATGGVFVLHQSHSS